VLPGLGEVSLGVIGGVGVRPAGGAGAGRGARDHKVESDLGEGLAGALVQGGQAGHPDRLAPAAVDLAGYERVQELGATLGLDIHVLKDQMRRAV
jgi:hypothetical protein